MKTADIRNLVELYAYPNPVRLCQRDLSHPHLDIHHRRGSATDVSRIICGDRQHLKNLVFRANPPEIMNMKQLLMVSAGGLAVNLWGMYATGHHHHGHGHSHDHDHGDGHHVSGVVCLQER
jgi:hypothetical protein